MHTNLEIEYKTMVTKEQFEKMILSYPNHQIIHQTNTYFKANQSNGRSAIRIREINGIYLFTLKVPQKNGVLEKEMQVKGNSPDDLNEPEILTCLNSFNLKGPYIQEGILHTERHLIIDEYGQLCLDKNSYGNTIDYEIEFEVKGEPNAGYDRFMKILKDHQIDFIPSRLSKYARCIQSK